MSLKTEIKKAEKTLTKVIQSELRNKGLVDTGTLLKSISVTIDKDLDIQIEAEDYYQYLDDEYSITKDAMEDPKVTSAIEDVVAAKIEEEIDKQIKKNK